MTSHDSIPFRGRAVDSRALEAFGKQAAHLAETGDLTMTDAVVQTIGHVKLNGEQVRRVVEFANIEIFNRKFAAMLGTTRSVHIDSGPADPAQVMQSLNNAARPREVVVDSLEYSMPPDLMKTSSSISFEEPSRTRNGILGEMNRLQQKLASAHDELIQDYEASKEMVSESFSKLGGLVKEASLAGATPAEIFSAWENVDSELAQIAYTKLAKLMNPSNPKVAGRSIDPGSRVVAEFRTFERHVKSAQAHSTKLAEVETELGRVSKWLGGVR